MGLYISSAERADVCGCGGTLASFARVFGCCWRARDVSSATMLEHGAEEMEQKPLEMYYNGL